MAALPGQTGNNTHPSVEIPADFDQLIATFICEATGATPTITYKWQVTFDPPEVSDANAQWTDLAYVVLAAAEDAGETFVTTTRTVTTVGRDSVLPYTGTKTQALPRRMRLVTTANTNITYRGEVQGRDRD
jgi:hypothetical protein